MSLCIANLCVKNKVVLRTPHTDSIILVTSTSDRSQVDRRGWYDMGTQGPSEVTRNLPVVSFTVLPSFPQSFLSFNIIGPYCPKDPIQTKIINWINWSGIYVNRNRLVARS